MGGDHGPAVVVEGAVLACRELGLRVSLVGPEAALGEGIRRARAEGLALDMVPAPDVVGMSEKVRLSTLKKRSSIQVALEQVRDGQADAFFSAGNTAACWTIAKMVLGTLPEIDRPALAAVVPHPGGRTVLLDVGANAEGNARNLEEFMIHLIREALMRTPRTRLGAWLSLPAFRAVRQQSDPAEFGGAPLLGMKGCCVIGHGKADERAIKHGIRAAAEFFGSGVNQTIESEVRTLGLRKEMAAE